MTPRGRQLPFGRVEQLRHVDLINKLQRLQSVYRQLGVQQALVLVKSIRKRSRLHLC